MKRIAITMGEPGGVGPEIAIKAAAHMLENAPEEFYPVLVGDPGVLRDAASLTGIILDPDIMEIIETDSAAGYVKGKPTSQGGLASAAAIKRATELAMAAEVHAIATAPISKDALRMAGLSWPGHTEMLAELTGTREYAMMLMGGGLRVMLVTIHTALSNVPALITRSSVLRTINLARTACAMFSIESPRIAVAGLNPHAGEAGMFGAEEQESISPAIEDARDQGIDASGPYPADTVFRRAQRGDFDLVVSMYHDQGLGPLKLIAFERGVNITVGLPIVRTSPDHGTAYDIAWQNTAYPTSMIEAVKTAMSMRAVHE